MESRDFVYLQEAYQEIYQLDEEVEIATEYFYEMGLDKEDVEGLIEELGVDGFNDYVCEILEEYGITNISEAAKWQDRLARGVLNAMERDRKAREQFGKTKVGKALSNIGSKAAAGLTAIGDVGEKGFDAGLRAAKKATRPSVTSKNIDKDEKDSPSPSPVSRRHRSHGRVKSGSRPIGRPSSVHSKKGVRAEKPYRTSRETLALPPVGTTKSGNTLTGSQRKMQTAAQNRRLAQRLGIDEDFELWVEGLWEEGYDLSDYTWEGLYEIYEGFQSPFATPHARGRSIAGDPNKGEVLGNPARLSPAMRAAQKSRQLQTTEPGSAREKTQTRRAKHLENMYGAARGTGNFAEEFEAWVEGLWEEGYDLSDYTWEGLYEAYMDLYEGYVPFEGKPMTKLLRKKGDLEYAVHPEFGGPGSDKQHSRLDKMGTVFRKMVTPPKPPKPTKKSKTKDGLPESYDVYDDVLNYLLDEGYAHDLESADAIIASMSEDWIVDILEGFVSPYEGKPSYNDKWGYSPAMRAFRKS